MNDNSVFIKNTECPVCPSSDGFSLYKHPDGRVHGYCQVCQKFEYSVGETSTANNVEYKPKESFMDLTNISSLSSIQEIPDRKISKEACERYGVRVGVSETTGEVDTHYYPIYNQDNKLSGYKRRLVAEKQFHILGEGKGMKLFGQNQAGNGSQMLVIVEGELDTLAAWQMFKARGKDYKVVGLPNGANTRAIADNLDWVSSFDTVVLSLDQDDAGQKATKDISAMLPIGKVKIMTFDEKDPSDMLVKGKVQEYFHALYTAREHKPDGIVTVEDLFDDAIKPVERGLSWPWKTLTDATYGYRRAEIYGFGAGSGCGKTEGFKEIINHVINEHKLPVGVLFLEEPVSKTLKVLAGKKVNKRFHIPDGDYTVEELVDGINDLKGKVYLYNHFGNKSWDQIKAKIRYMVVALGIKDIFLDHLTALVAQEDNEYKALNKIMEEMSSLAQELQFTLFYISHLRKAAGTPHEEGGHVAADQFKGSGSIVFWSNFLFGYERNQQADSLEERNTTTFRVLKDRNTGLSTGVTFKLWYDHDTGRWREKTDKDGYEDDMLEG